MDVVGNISFITMYNTSYRINLYHFGAF